MARNDPVPDTANLIRWVKNKFAPRDEAGELIGIHPDAFSLRDDEEYLSLTCREGFGGDVSEQMIAADRAIGLSFDSGKLPAKSFLIVGPALSLKERCLEEGHKVRILEEPEDGNPAHVAVRRYPKDLPALYEKLASMVFVERHDVMAIRAALAAAEVAAAPNNNGVDEPGKPIA